MGLRDGLSKLYGDVADAFNATYSQPVRGQSQPQSQPQSQSPRAYPLVSKFASITLDGSGNGTVTIGPQRVREHWQVASVAVSVTPIPPAVVPANEAQCGLYLGTTPVSSQLVGQTATGSSGDTCGLNGQDITTGQLLIAKWTGGDPGAQATMTVQGSFTTGVPQ